MRFDPRDAVFMKEALELALKGLGRASPNPMVGCVLVKGGKVVGRGYHAQFGGPHAEVGALKQAGKRARGATAYVTLEPCCHFGKTPPCTAALIEAGVKKVVAAMGDPDARVHGKGFAELKAAGIKVESGLLEDEARELNRAYIVHRTQGRPYVVLKAAASLDGKIVAANGESKWITSPQARREAHLLRSRADGILVGIGTVLADDPELTSHGAGRDPVRVILDSELRIPPKAKVLRPGGPLTVIATAVKSPAKLARLKRANLSLVQVKRVNGGVDLRDLLSKLQRIGIATLLVEGGSKVHTSFLDQDLVDEVRLFIAPKLIGGEKSKTIFEGAGRPLARALKLASGDVRRVGEDFLFSGRLHVHGHR
jgi:diaminohydroxyphosphoribosylaminopyrimidine deaminase/5-amino-6-(5-phosphoribosylamino)uracil reductase